MRKYEFRYDEESVIKPRQYLNVLDLKDGRDSLLPDLVKRFANKVIYIDLWATWCGPCLKEMDYYSKLIEKYKDQDLVFVFLAAHSPENLWRKRVNDLKLTGNHYLLDESQYYGLEDYFDLHGFPQHVIINRKGDIVESRGPTIYDSEHNLNPNLLSTLNELLEK